MNGAAARRELHKYLNAFRRRGYKALIQDLGNRKLVTVTGEDGRYYEIAVEIRWEGRPGDDIRVVGLIDDRQLGSAMFPITEDFIVTSDGQVVE
jgi:hypothetical protein